ncbi:hypothetical protein DFH08DRAFT_1028048 [Mycena albidolilacea]|uniref:Uncharacterized protein n=1 Tax=Mycena albidolilacea TaxID=1033008 RepID=A0AAD7EHH2_9AGAR|nr:hypothetical protein DFH08DRAFT_1028048 [Mycena albidolilacea]
MLEADMAVERKEEASCQPPMLAIMPIIRPLRWRGRVPCDTGLGIVTVPVQDGWTDGQTGNRPVLSLGYWSPQHAVPSPDSSEEGRPVHRKTEGRTDDYGRNFCSENSVNIVEIVAEIVADPFVSRSLLISDVKTRSSSTCMMFPPSYYMSDEDWDSIKLVSEWPFLFKGATAKISTTKKPILSETHTIFRIKSSICNLPVLINSTMARLTGP